MDIYMLRCELLSTQPISKLFAIFEDPYNLSKITPPWLNFRVTSADHVHMREGAEIRYVIKWLGLPMGWKTNIIEYKPPFKFVDEQAKGPYALWRHHHSFEETPQGTKVADRVEYALPLGLLGRAAHALLVRRQLLAIFEYRQRELAKMFAGRTELLLRPVITRLEKP